MGITESMASQAAFPLAMTPKEVKELAQEVRVECGSAQNPWHFLASLYEPEGASADRVVVYVHGNCETIYSVDDMLRGLSERLKVRICSFDWPGYGRVEGHPTEENMVECCQKTIYMVKRRYGIRADNILLWARSIGSVAGVAAAANNCVAGLLLESPLASAQDAVRIYVPGAHGFNNAAAIGQVRCPIAIVAGSRDE